MTNSIYLNLCNYSPRFCERVLGIEAPSSLLERVGKVKKQVLSLLDAFPQFEQMIELKKNLQSINDTAPYDEQMEPMQFIISTYKQLMAQWQEKGLSGPSPLLERIKERKQQVLSLLEASPQLEQIIELKKNLLSISDTSPYEQQIAQLKALGSTHTQVMAQWKEKLSSTSNGLKSTTAFVAQYLPSGKTVLIGAAATVALAALFIGYKVYAAKSAATETKNEKEAFLTEVRQNDLQSMNRASNGLGGFKGQIVSRAQFAFAIFANMVNVVKNVALLAFATVKTLFSVEGSQQAKVCVKNIGLGILNVPVSVVGTLVPELGRLAFEGELQLATGVVPSRADRQIFSA